VMENITLTICLSKCLTHMEGRTSLSLSLLSASPLSPASYIPLNVRKEEGEEKAAMLFSASKGVSAQRASGVSSEHSPGREKKEEKEEEKRRSTLFALLSTLPLSPLPLPALCCLHLPLLCLFCTTSHCTPLSFLSLHCTLSLRRGREGLLETLMLSDSSENSAVEVGSGSLFIVIAAHFPLLSLASAHYMPRTLPSLFLFTHEHSPPSGKEESVVKENVLLCIWKSLSHTSHGRRLSLVEEPAITSHTSLYPTTT